MLSRSRKALWRIILFSYIFGRKKNFLKVPTEEQQSVEIVFLIQILSPPPPPPPSPPPLTQFLLIYSSQVKFLSF